MQRLVNKPEQSIQVQLLLDLPKILQHTSDGFCLHAQNIFIYLLNMIFNIKDVETLLL